MICTECLVDKPEAEFNYKYKETGVRNRRCRACCSKYHRAYYQENKVTVIEQRGVSTRRWKNAQRERVWQYLAEHPCVDCGETDPVVLEFDHVGNKTENISRLVGKASWEEIEAEIAKCEVRCANCHRRRTAKQFGWYAPSEAPRPVGRPSTKRCHVCGSTDLESGRSFCKEHWREHQREVMRKRRHP